LFFERIILSCHSAVTRDKFKQDRRGTIWEKDLAGLGTRLAVVGMGVLAGLSQAKEDLVGKGMFLTGDQRNTVGDQKVIVVGFKKFIIYIGICYN